MKIDKSYLLITPVTVFKCSKTAYTAGTQYALYVVRADRVLGEYLFVGQMDTLRTVVLLIIGIIIVILLLARK